MPTLKRKLIILVSGAGSNMQAIVRASQVQHWESRLGLSVACIVSNRPHAGALDFARAQGIATQVVDHDLFATRKLFDEALVHACSQFDDQYAPCLIALSGFMRILTPTFVDYFKGRLINIHPSLLPAFKGLNTHQRALDAGCCCAGASVHFVTNELDEGRIIDQIVVPILPGDDQKSLAARVLSQEHILYPRAIVSLMRAQFS